jgi:hypothetical protein
MNQLKAGVVRSFAPSLLPEAQSAWPRWAYKRFSDSYYSLGPKAAESQFLGYDDV